MSQDAENHNLLQPLVHVSGRNCEDVDDQAFLCLQSRARLEHGHKLAPHSTVRPISRTAIRKAVVLARRDSNLLA
eukprot:CAMPEP_0177790506 /NCGR_PEP_ID=MMETSP0491_2-20121128/23397_1 /TAXON_ID=63592 /ORGANISM="Tetraselmis chuii, Strain PLY429" /LENGTH=74 /DNA_ID=CAMNT_0019312597 /DNA_START=27 /DNA_END=248 /DNA_ORIENTATION=-